MNMTKVADESFRLSHSSANLYRSCPRKYYYQKVAKIQPDPDVKDDAMPLRVGSAFHKVLEDTWHGEKPELLEPKPFSQILKGALKDQRLSEDERVKAMIHAMCLKYFELHRKSGLKCVAIEHEIKTDNIIGYIDAIMQDSKGYWYVVDMKTASSVMRTTVNRLINDPQLNLYASFVDGLAREYKLDPRKFRGARYRINVKTTATFPKGGKHFDAVRKFLDKVKSIDIHVPIDPGYAHGVRQGILQLQHMIGKLKETYSKDSRVWSQNFNHCESYHRPCEFWSKCHHCTFSEGFEMYELLDSDSMVDQTYDPKPLVKSTMKQVDFGDLLL